MNKSKSLFRKDILSLLIYYSKSEFKRLIIYSILRLVGIFIAVLIPLLYSNIISSLLLQHIKSISINICFLCISYLARIILNHILRYLDAVMDKNISFKVRCDIIYKLTCVPQYVLKDYDYGKMYDLVYNDASQIYFVVKIILSAFFTIISIISVGVVCIFTNWILTILLLFVYPFSYFVNKIFRNKIKKASLLLFDENDGFVGDLKNLLANLFEVKVQNFNDPIVNNLCVRMDKLKSRSLKLNKTQILFATIISVLNCLGNILVTIFGIILILLNRLSLGNFVAFNSYSRTLSSSIDTLMNTKTNLQPSLLSVGRVAKLYSLYADFYSTDKKLFASFFNISSIELNNLTISYEKKEIIKDFNLVANIKDIIGIKGVNGSGKTSIAKCILYQLSNPSGTIIINSVPLDRISYEIWTKCCSYVGTNSVLYNMSIRENIVGNSKFNDEEILNICKIVSIYDDILKFDNGLDTVLNEVESLSVGQIRKIQIARTLMSNAQVLIFDEALSNLDAETKSEIQRYLNVISKNKIIIIISHYDEDLSICNKKFYISKI